jgi:glyoxalase family protein
VGGADALQFWKDRLDEQGVTAGEIVERDGRQTLDFEDPEGQRLALVDDGGVGDAHPWDRSPVPAEHQVRGLGPILITIPDLAPTDAILQKVTAMRPVREYANPDSPRHTIHVYEMGQGGPGAELHVAVRPDIAVARSGAGGVHHVAFRTADDDYDAWADRLNSMRVPNSGKVDRFWFRSLYFREPNGVLFEIATEGPGFAVDEDPATLGEKVVLPPFLEPQRERIVAGLKPID